MDFVCFKAYVEVEREEEETGPSFWRFTQAKLQSTIQQTEQTSEEDARNIKEMVVQSELLFFIYFQTLEAPTELLFSSGWLEISLMSAHLDQSELCIEYTTWGLAF